jgi:tripartite-type tricarboxylate transporter receptor subunit TctC
MNFYKYLRLSFWFATFLFCLGSVQAQQWPDRPIKIIVPFAPGGGADFMARIISQPLSTALGQPVIVENKLGASGIIGYDYGIKSPPDGYTLIIVSTTYSIIPSLFKLPYDPIKDIEPITLLSKGPYLITVHPSLPVKNLKELISLAQSKPESISYSSGGNGSNLHLVSEMFSTAAGIKMIHVPYKGTGPAIISTVGNQTSVVFGSMYSTMPLVRDGRLKPLAITSLQRNPVAPDIPTVSEAAIPNFDTFDWQGLIAPKGTPKPIIDRLNNEVNKILKSKEVYDRLITDGIIASGNQPNEFGSFIAKENEVFKKTIEQAKVKVD